MCVFSVVQSCLTFFNPWTVAHQAPLFMEFPRQNYWSGLPFPSSGHLPNLGIKPASPASPALAGGFFTICKCTCIGGMAGHAFDPLCLFLSKTLNILDYIKEKLSIPDSIRM